MFDYVLINQAFLHVHYVCVSSTRVHVQILNICNYANMFSSVSGDLSVRQSCSLLAQVSGHVAALEALEVIETLGQPLGGLTVGSAAIGQSVGAAALQALQTAQITLLRIRQHVCEVGIAGGEENIRTHIQTHTNTRRCLG